MTTTKKKRIVKAWAVLSGRDIIGYYSDAQIEIYRLKETARYQSWEDNGDESIVPITITYHA